MEMGLSPCAPCSCAWRRASSCTLLLCGGFFVVVGLLVVLFVVVVVGLECVVVLFVIAIKMARTRLRVHFFFVLRIPICTKFIYAVYLIPIS